MSENFTLEDAGEFEVGDLTFLSNVQYTDKRGRKHFRGINAPTYWEVMTWFRQKYDMHIEPSYRGKGCYDAYLKSETYHLYHRVNKPDEVCRSYNEACLIAIDKALEIIKSREDDSTGTH